jgi:hypothetical protein
MRTTVDLDEELVRNALAASGARTKTEVERLSEEPFEEARLAAGFFNGRHMIEARVYRVPNLRAASV